MLVTLYKHSCVGSDKLFFYQAFRYCRLIIDIKNFELIEVHSRARVFEHDRKSSPATPGARSSKHTRGKDGTNDLIAQYR